ncbi:TIGR02444 family protein [Variovorax sp. KK3]|uniref:TIGR02444 family protein n=1 Tax=Variovorax sp. KK3 TaxID=1855728 RepID=UPI00097C2679|nr:TIGR02444 family protein [Variovorax sp. KK3]
MPLPIDADSAWAAIGALYADPALQQTLLRRQDDEGLDVVLHLFAQWATTQGHPLGDAALEEARTLVAPWRNEVIAPLRALRRTMKPMTAGAAGLEAVRDQVKAAELAAERAQVQMLCNWLQAR